MSYVVVDNCLNCGAPVYSPTLWQGIIPPPLTRTCGCHGWAKSVLSEKSTQPTQTERELITLLSDYVGETGQSEGAVEVLSRLLTELEGCRDEKRTKKESD